MLVGFGGLGFGGLKALDWSEVLKASFVAPQSGMVWSSVMWCGVL